MFTQDFSLEIEGDLYMEVCGDYETLTQIICDFILCNRLQGTGGMNRSTPRVIRLPLST